MLEIKNLYSGYSKTEVLHGISLTARAGEITAILGPNGCGKSTFLKTLCRIVPASSGQILLNGQDLLTLSSKVLAQNVTYLPQNRQFPDMTVGRLVLHGRFPYLNYPRKYREEDYQVVKSVLEQLEILDLADIPLGQLSGGQQQKAYIAMALAQDTGVILLDEPTTFLDISYQLQFLRLAKMLAGSGKHVLMVLHDLSMALENADRAALMADGNLVIQGTPEDVYNSGALEQVFGVSTNRTIVQGQWRYFQNLKTHS